LEWDITFANAGSYQLWLDGVSILSGSGDTTGSANAFANVFVLQNPTVTWDDLYLFDATGTTNNAVLLTSPRIETSFPNGDGAVQFTIGPAVLGRSITLTVTNFSTGANTLYLRPFTPVRNCTLNSIGILGGSSSNASIQVRPIVYADSSGVPGTLMSAGSSITGLTAGAMHTLPLTTPQNLTAGTQYWLGWQNDTVGTFNFSTQDGSLQGRTATVTFGTSAPGTAPAMTAGIASASVWGNITNTNANFVEVNQNPPLGNSSYVYESVVGEEDLYIYPSLSTPPSNIYAVAVKANLAKSDAGAKTVSVRLKSNTTDSAGSAGTVAPGTSFAWLVSFYPTDPNGNVPWTLSALNAIQAGLRIES